MFLLEVFVANGCVRFGEFALDRTAYQLRRGDQVVHIERIPFDLLSFLVDRPGELLSREEIAAHIWGKGVYLDTENGINTAIRKVRSALGDDSGTPRFVITVPTKGYRFVAQIDGLFRDRSVDLAALPRILLAVLPFTNLSNDPGQEYFVDGLTEETITDLGEFGSTRLGVIARTSAMGYKNTQKNISQISRELGVDFVVGGSVRRVGDQLRISVQLNRASDQTQIWARNYACEMKDILSIQAQFGRAIADHIRAELAPFDNEYLSRIPTTSQPAHDAYLHGRFHLWRVVRPSIERAITCFQEATRLDPRMAVAYSGIADAYDILPITSDTPPREAFPKAEQAALRALEIDPTLSEAHATLSSVRFWNDWNWVASEEHARRALARNPSNSLAHLRFGHLLSNIGRHEEAIAQIEIARALDPFSLITNTLYAQFRLQAGLFDEVAPLLARALELEPHFWVAQIVAAKFYIHENRYPEALTAAQQARDFSAGNTEAIALVGATYGLMGQHGEAETILTYLLQKRKDEFVPAYNIATVCMGMGNRPMVLDWLEKAYEERGVHLVFLKVEPHWDGFRDETRFKELLRLIGLPG